MELIEQTGKLTQADRRAERMWNAAPWLALMFITLVPPVVLSLIALLFGGAPLWLLAIASLPVSFLIAVVVAMALDRKSTRLNSSHGYISYAVFCLKKKKTLARLVSQLI